MVFPTWRPGTSLGQVGIRGLIIRFTVSSSSGSAVTVSAGLVPITFSAKTDSSIIGSTGVNGFSGIKPTVGLTSRTGTIPISKNMDTVWCFGRTVADAVAGLNAVVG